MNRLLISSFEPFGTHTVNVSTDVARRLWEEGVDGCDLVTVRLPVVRFEAATRLIDTFDRVRPDVAIMLGIADSHEKITPERIAINMDDFRIPDNAGNQPRDEPVIPGAPAAYFSTLPVSRIASALATEGIPAEVSNSAGTYLCNHVSFALLHHIERTGTPCRAGFIHLPPEMPLAMLVRGVALGIDAVFHIEG